MTNKHLGTVQKGQKQPKNHLKKAKKRPEQCLKIALCDRLFDATLRPTSKSRGARSLRSPARCAREGLPWISRWASVTYYFYYGIPYALYHTYTYFLRIDIHHTTYHGIAVICESILSGISFATERVLH